MDEFLNRLADPLIMLPLIYLALAIPFLFEKPWFVLRSSIYRDRDESRRNLLFVRICMAPTVLLAAGWVVMNL